MPSPGSVMPAYPHMLTDRIPFESLQSRVDAMAMLGVPYGKAILDDATVAAKQQAGDLAAKLVSLGGPQGMEDKDIIALIAYLQRLGVDIRQAKGGIQ